MASIQEQILAQVPETGEIEFNQLVTNLHLAGAHDAPSRLIQYKQRGVLAFRLDKQPEDTKFTVMVSRKGAE